MRPARIGASPGTLGSSRRSVRSLIRSEAATSALVRSGIWLNREIAAASATTSEHELALDQRPHFSKYELFGDARGHRVHYAVRESFVRRPLSSYWPATVWTGKEI